ncbi:TOMM precursor leader peptide-binding protein [Streptomyces sp. WZ-12]|uniref:TOMM precursor leader peptide-binding protein n=1 Tax=Streptomyces sp. WZ-12 TaxID=3030210 RepID=UPI0023816249|nr:TOMM precursor leader peptide-binding protein [Streptomyces sp. WZ-12]
MLKPALRRGWRDRETVWFGVAPAHARSVGPVDVATGCFIELLDGTRSLPQLLDEAVALDVPPERARGVVERLGAAGLLEAPAADGPAADALRADGAAVERLRADLGALSVRQRGGASGPLARMGARRSVRVKVKGAGRVGAQLAALLSGSGVGRVDVVDGGTVAPWDVVPGGPAAGQIGERRAEAAGRLVRESSPWSGRPRTGAPVTESGTPGISLMVLAPRDGLGAYAPDPVLAEPLLAAGIPHLYAGVLEGTGVVGPLVVPGVSACAGCDQLRRTDAEPAWPRLLAQWRSGRGTPAVPACDAALATAVAGLAAIQALAYLDGEPPPCTGARMELPLPCASVRTVRIAPHPDCGCGAAAERGPADASVPRPRHATMTG